MQALSYRIKFKKQLSGYLFILPAVLLFIVFVVVPVINSFVLSFSKYDFASKVWVGLDNYRHLLRDEVFLKSIVNTIKFVIIVVPSTIIFALLFSVIILKKTERMQTFFRAIFYLPVVVSVVSFSIVWNWIYNPAFGFANYFLSLFNLEPVNWLGDSRITIISLSLIVFIYNLGQPLIIYMASIGSMPKSYYEAAEIDGATEAGKFFRITLPMLAPTNLYVFVTSTIAAFQIFALINLMTGGGPNYESSTILFLVYQTAFSFGQFGLASAMGIVLFMIVLIFSLVQFKMFSKNVEY